MPTSLTVDGSGSQLVYRNLQMADEEQGELTVPMAAFSAGLSLTIRRVGIGVLGALLLLPFARRFSRQAPRLLLGLVAQLAVRSAARLPAGNVVLVVMRRVLLVRRA